MSKAMARLTKRKLVAASNSEVAATCAADQTSPSRPNVTQRMLPRKRKSARLVCRHAEASRITPAAKGAGATDGYSTDDSSDRSSTGSSDSAGTAGKTTAQSRGNQKKPKKRRPKIVTDTEGMTEEEKREDRARRNRASALKSRNKRRTRLAFLEVECKRLADRINDLEKENSQLLRDNTTLRGAYGRDPGAVGVSPCFEEEDPTQDLIRQEVKIEEVSSANTTQKPRNKRPRPAVPLTQTRLNQHADADAAGNSVLVPSPAVAPFESFLDFDATQSLAANESNLALDADALNTWTTPGDAVLTGSWENHGVGPEHLEESLLASKLIPDQMGFDRLISA